MKILKKDELLAAEAALLQHLPKAFKVYGYLHGLNRNKPCKWEVVVDSWPDFKAIVCRPNPENQPPFQMMSFFSADEKALKKFLEGDSAVDWSSPYIIAGIDTAYGPMLKEVCSKKKVNIQQNVLVHLMHLPDSTHLPTLTVDSENEMKISSLSSSHVDLVNNTWKFGGNAGGYRSIDNWIKNFPSSCITDKQGQPVAWILMYDYCAMGLLYTLPEHRGKGYAKVLISSMVKKICAKGYPVYCYIEVDNEVSYRLFKKMGFINDPSYEAAWFDVSNINN
ncbi:glycine N-acyltransferase-like protein 3 [Nelusetta ayraudi]|uniref:glycine N-acyltransferase-like protein 3 n=1 Tax=Nelusetta ayraudi TaxID=303726 RepID=UPI003F709946